MDIQEVVNTIAQLENDVTTFENCFKLASLYTVRDNYEKQMAKEEQPKDDVSLITTTEPDDTVEREYSDILPQYKEYVDIKRKFQLGEIAETAVATQIQKVCLEISEFVRMLYSCTDIPVEREYIKDMIGGLQNL